MEINTNRKIKLDKEELAILARASDIIGDMIEDMDENFEVYAVNKADKDSLSDVTYFNDVSNILYEIVNADSIEVGE